VGEADRYYAALRTGGLPKALSRLETSLQDGAFVSSIHFSKAMVHMFEPLEVKALANYRIWIRYADGSEGEVDVSHLAGHGVFKLWEDEEKWKNVRIADDGAIRWSEEVELCPDATYMKLTGKSPEEIFPKLKSTAHA
jgi:hypothetical protein